MKNKLIVVFFLLVFAFFGLLIPTKIFAQEVIKNFDVLIVAHKDGTMSVKETIEYDFDNLQRHGIYRDIPLVSKVGDLYRVIEINFEDLLRDGNPEQYSTSNDSSKISVKIGKAQTLISGKHTYTISYLIKNGIGSNYADHDEIYWNITGNSWNVPILEASAKIETDFGVIPNKAICFTGVQGSTLQNCDFSQVSLITTTQSLGSNEGLTGVWGFPKDTFPASFLQKKAPVFSGTSGNFTITPIMAAGILAVPIFLNLILAPGLLIWYFKNKRKKQLSTPVVNFNIPKDDKGKRVAPAEAGSIDAYQVDQNDVIATIFDLAVRKYLKIEQAKQKKVLGIFGGGEEYVFTKLKEFGETMEPFELMLGSALFAESDSIELSSLKKDFYITFQCFEKDVFNSLIARKYYNKNPKTQMALLLIAGIFVIFAGGIILGLVLIFLSRKLNGRTVLGDEMDWKIDGLKIFLKNMKTNYKWQAKNLYIVENLIPYAIAFGFINEFMDQLKAIYPNYKPTWYSGNLAFYSAIYSMNSSMNSSFTTSAPGSSSGFSGGSSGGGGGGGGGGSW